MQIVRDLEAYRPSADLLLTIGVFDGVHIGHRAVLERLRQRRTGGALTAAMTFERHPQEFLNPSQAPKVLTTVWEKINLLDACGLDVLFLLPFDARIQQLSAATFVRDVLLRRLRTQLLVVGANWRFGKDREGDAAFAQSEFERAGRTFEIEHLLERHGARVSSSHIRELLEARRFAEADELLGSPYTLRGIVRGGEGRGHLLGYPTANLELPSEKLVPGDGVYACRVRYDGTEYRAVTSIGNKPTFGGDHPAVEIFILDFSRSIYGEELAISRWKFLREQAKFESAAALVEQIERDVAATRVR